MSNIRIVPEDELAYARDRVVSWCTKPWPDMTLAQVQSIALLLAMERQKAVEQFAPRRQRRICEPEGLPITLPADSGFENEVTEPRGKK